MNRLSTQQLLQATNPNSMIDAIITYWPDINQEEQQELCLEHIYEILAQNAPVPENFTLLSSDQKAQHEINIDMLLITIDLKEIGSHLFKEEKNSAYFWSQIKKTEKSKAIFKKLF